MDIIYYNNSSRTKTIITINIFESIDIKSQDRLMIPKNSNYYKIEYIKKYILLSKLRYTLYERDQYLVFFLV